MLDTWRFSFIKLFRRPGPRVFQQPARSRLVTALAIPTRAYAAALVATGVVISRVKTVTDGQASPAKHFEMLCGLPAGTSVIVSKNGRKKKGFLQGPKVFDGTTRIGVQTQGRDRRGGGLTEYLTPEMSMNVQVSPDQWTRLPSKQDGTEILPNRGFVEQIFQGLDLWNLVTNSSLECVILGYTGLLTTEVKSAAFSIGSQKSGFVSGSLLDILRVSSLLKSNEAYRSNILPVNTSGSPTPGDNPAPSVVIFDGATGFLKWRDNWTESNWVVLLDCTETHFDEAVDLINKGYLDRRGEQIPKLAEPTPPGVELVTYWVER